MRRNGVLFEDQGVLVIPSLDATGLSTDADGNTRDFTGLNDSHIMIFGATDLRFGPPGTDPVGNYEFFGSLRDARGNGWDFAVPFQVIPEVPEPSTLALAGLSLAGWVVFARRRKSGT